MFKNRRLIVLVGDVIVLALVTLFGFASHNELGSAGLRMLTTFLPLALAWGLVSPHLGVYADAVLFNGKQLWRPFWAMVLAGPMAGFLRGVLLNNLVSPLFVVILGGVSALAILAWRTIFWMITRQGKAADHG